MNFSLKIKNEILNKFNKETHCKKAFLTGYIRGSGVLVEKDDVFGIEIKANSIKEQEFLIDYLSFLYDIDTTEIASFSCGKKGKKIVGVYGEQAVNLLTDLEILLYKDGEFQINLNMFDGKTTKKDCCLRAFFRGLFLACGNCSVPMDKSKSNTGYHLQLVFSHSVPAEVTVRTLYKYNIQAKIVRRKENFVVYLKSCDQIKDFIAFLPAPISVLNFTDLMINREISNNSNRQKNCDLGNLNRQIEASIKQIDAIKKLVSVGMINQLKKELKETALARLDYPDETLLELAQRLNVSKSCLNHRLRKIVGLSDQV